jgi:hypothetical protein
MAEAISTLELPGTAETAGISDLDFLSAEEQATLRSLLTRIAIRKTSTVVDLNPNGKSGGKQLVTIIAPPDEIRSVEPGSPEWEEMDRILAQPEEFVEFEPITFTMKSSPPSRRK